MQANLKSMGLAVLCAGLFTPIVCAQNCLTTTFASNNGGSTGWGNAFDVNVKNPKGLKITTIDVNSSSAVNSTVKIEVYLTPKTYVGNETNAAVWTKVSTGSGPGKGRNTPTPINVSDFFLAPGKHGMWIHYVSGSPAYTNGTGSNQSYSNKDLALTLGVSRAGFFSGTRFSPRVWNGKICYAADDKAASGAHGFACPGTNNQSPVLSVSADPIIGTTPSLKITNMVNQITGGGLVFLGLKQVKQDLTSIGMPKCALFNDALVIWGFANIRGSASLSLPVPNDKGLIGAIVHLQAANPDKGANPLGMAATPGLSIRAGNK